IGAFNLTWMLHTPLTRTLPVGLADSYASMRIGVGSAYTLIFLVVIMAALWELQALATLVQKHDGNWAPHSLTQHPYRTRAPRKALFGWHPGSAPRRPGDRGGRSRRVARTVRLRQDNAAQAARGTRDTG